MTRRLLPALAVLALVALLQVLFLGDVENRVYDGKVRLFSRVEALPVVLVAIDQGSIDFYARNFQVTWPWPRSLYGRAIRFLKGAGARLVALDMIFSEASPFEGEDGRLAAEMAAAGNVALPLFFSERGGAAPAAERFALGAPPSRPALPRRDGVQAPAATLLPALAAAGNASDRPDADGVYRRLQQLVVHRGRVFPSFSLAMATFLRHGYDAGRLPLDRDGTLKVHFYKPASFPVYAMDEVIQSQVLLEEGRPPVLDPALFQGKAVIIGATAPGLLDIRPTPLDGRAPGFRLHATALANLLRNETVRRPPPWLLGALLALLLGGLAWLLERSRGVTQRALVGFAVALLVVAACLLPFAWRVDLPLLPPLAGVALLSTWDVWSRYRRARRDKLVIQNAFQNYLSDSLLQQIMERPEALKLGGEKKPVTVFFSDLAGFTSFSETMSPEELVRVLNLYLERMTAILRSHDGYLDKFEGDAIMAFWGAPLAVDDPAGKAMGAALDCQTALARFNDEFSTQGLPRLAMRIGINSGEVVAGNIGALGRKINYTVIGDAVNLASRLEGINKPYGTSIICGSASRALCPGGMAFRHLDRVRVKGKAIPEEIYEVVGRAGEVGEERRRAIAAFEEALEHYFVGDFARAAPLFARLSGDDRASALFAQRCRYLIENPPERWEGVWTFHEK